MDLDHDGCNSDSDGLLRTWILDLDCRLHTRFGELDIGFLRIRIWFFFWTPFARRAIPLVMAIKLPGRYPPKLWRRRANWIFQISRIWIKYGFLRIWTFSVFS